MDDSPADADALVGMIPPYPFRPPDTDERPWPDPMAIRLVPVPDCNPPFDDELPGGRILTSLVYPLVADHPGDPVPPAEPDGDEGPDAGSPPDEADELGGWPSRFAQVLAETLAGARPASQLTPWTTERARTSIRRLGPLLAVDRRPRVQRVRATQPATDVVEVAVVAEFGSRTRALAARLERAEAQSAGPGRPGRDARWLCTAIESA
ncbi:MAG: hypothetical protein JO016_00435 [Actinobacteria bacterium]|nr:hypothetical protein [Actinomycetota bacterium]